LKGSETVAGYGHFENVANWETPAEFLSAQKMPALQILRQIQPGAPSQMMAKSLKNLIT
jgi:hypothetical protein